MWILCMNQVNVVEMLWSYQMKRLEKKTIYVGGKFFKYEYQDQMSILYHEAYHCNHDEAWSSKTQMLLDSPYNLQIPPEHVDYLLKCMKF